LGFLALDSAQKIGDVVDLFVDLGAESPDFPPANFAKK